ncbi:TetR/AcrR family transcriptional regulator [Streptomyces antarcticus]|uniref:TetR/AcrR family transcriptional regulator n=1 Tax=Streptomyces antarcticus TaxID=2996458 RepID=UPI00226FFEEA|nr:MULTISPECIES: TetR/AcrR family transcriptional regulator [unclassified Streptomyces]MCY0946056.1 helix-turn-helix domain containing protein [Streptomyces sp. H34-AA3]MCY0950361.1 helix-turn-helix domain containing protein [Streptomyces sp. H27-S2]MCZ4084373.1 helix-turn-helix domain containing protein [Streptomyces sp. H34-S5]
MADRQASILEAAVRVIARTGVRGLRVEELAAEAGVSTALIYYHFKDRAGLVRRTLAFIGDRAAGYTDEALEDSEDARAVLIQLLLGELQDIPRVRENSIAWGELRASAIFDGDLRAPLAESTRSWSRDTAEAVADAQAAGLADPRVVPLDAAERLTALVEGLSERWLSGSLTLDRARALLTGAVDAELGPHPAPEPLAPRPA